MDCPCPVEQAREIRAAFQKSWRARVTIANSHTIGDNSLGPSLLGCGIGFVPLPGSHLTRYTSGPFSLHCSEPRLLTAAPEGGLKPLPAKRLRGTCPHRLCSYAKQVVCRRLVLLVAHLEDELCSQLYVTFRVAISANRSKSSIVDVGIRASQHRVVERIEHLQSDLGVVSFAESAVLFDILIVNVNEPPSLLRNDAPASNHWLKVKLVGTKSNRSAIGSRVVVHYDGKLQCQQLLSQSSYLSSNDPRLHFGLGTVKKVDVEIFWPNGLQESLKDVTADQLITVHEGKVSTREWVRSRGLPVPEFKKRR